MEIDIHRMYGEFEATGDEVVVPEGEYTLKVVSVPVIRGQALRPLCKIVGGAQDGSTVCPGYYDFGWR